MQLRSGQGSVTRWSGDSLFTPICLVLLAGAMVASAIYFPLHSLTHDASWYLVATRKFLNGAELYSDIIEINPPLAFYLTAPALLLSDIARIDPTRAYFIYCILLGGVSSLWFLGLLNRAALERPERAFAFFAVLIVFFLHPIAEFGQREHLMVLLATPYLGYLVQRERLESIGGFEQVALGCWAFLGLALKPYFLLIPAVIIVLHILQKRSLRVAFGKANIALGTMLVLYLAFIWVVHPAYVTEIVPLARLVYSAYGAHPLAVFLKVEILAFGIIFLLFFSNRQALPRSTWLWFVAAGGALVSYFIQFKGWNYHVLPASGLMILSLGSATEALLFGRARKVSNILLFIIGFTLALSPQLGRGPYGAAPADRFRPFVSEPETPILVMGTNVWISFPFVNKVSGDWVSRYPAQWVLPGAMRRIQDLGCSKPEGTCGQLYGALEDARYALIQDLEKGEPKIVFVDEREKKSYFGEIDFDYLTFLSEDPRFGRLWDCYQPIAQVADYSVWQRRCGSSVPIDPDSAN